MEKRATARDFWLRLVLVLLLLVAQQSALTHKVWHFVGSVASDTELSTIAQVPLERVPAQEILCALHTALGAALGVIAGDGAPVALAATEEVHVSFPDRPAGVYHAVRPVSRGPPPVL
jgi:hypothetical protein